MGLGFQIDIFNDTNQTVVVWATTPPNMNAGGFTNVTLPPHTRLSQVGNQTPQYAELAGDTAALTINVMVTNQAGPPQGAFIVEFDSTQLVNFPGVVCFGSANDLATPVQLPSGNVIYATLYLGIWGQWTEGTLVLLETVGSVSLT